MHSVVNYVVYRVNQHKSSTIMPRKTVTFKLGRRKTRKEAFFPSDAEESSSDEEDHEHNGVTEDGISSDDDDELVELKERIESLEAKLLKQKKKAKKHKRKAKRRKQRLADIPEEPDDCPRIVKRVGNRVEVWEGIALRTGGGLTKKDLFRTGHGQIKSKRASAASKRTMNINKVNKAYRHKEEEEEKGFTPPRNRRSSPQQKAPTKRKAPAKRVRGNGPNLSKRLFAAKRRSTRLRGRAEVDADRRLAQRLSRRR